MKGIILALVLTLAEVKCPVGKTLLYKYVGEAHSGLQDEATPRTGLRMHFDLKISALSNGRCRLTLSNAKMEDYLVDSFVHSPKQTQELKHCCNHPIDYDQNVGRGGKLFFQRSTPEVCRNIGRGIVDGMIVTYKEQTMYQAQESGIEGDCDTQYTHLEDMGNNKVTITKIKNLMNCEKKVEQNIGMAYIRSLPSCPLKDKLLAGTQISTYKAKFEDDTILITESEINQLYKVSPDNEVESSGFLKAKKLFTLTGVKTESQQQQQQQKQKQKQQQQQQQQQQQEQHAQDQDEEDIYYKFSDQPQMALHMVETDNIPQQIMAVVQELVRSDPAGSDADSAKKYLKAVELVRRGDLNDLTTVFKRVKDEPRLRLILLHVLAMSGSINSLELLKTAVHDNQLNYFELLLIIPETLHFANPTERAASLAAEIITSPQIRNEHWLSMTNVLAYGALAFRCLSQSPSISNEILKPLHDRLAEAIEREDEQDITLCLKALSNAAHIKSMKLLMRILFAHNKYSDEILVDAVLAVRQVARMDPQKGQEVLIVPYMDSSYPPVVRMMACINLFELNPSLPLITAMANVAANDDNLRFRKFVTSHISECAGLRVPQYAEVSAACKVALKVLKVPSFNTHIRYSGVRIWKISDRQDRFVLLQKMFTMNSPQNPLLSDAMLTTQLLFPGGTTNLFEARVHSDVLKEILKDESQREFDQKISQTEQEVPEAYPESQGQSLSFSMFDKQIAYFVKPMKENLKNMNNQDKYVKQIKKSLENLKKGISVQAYQPAALVELRHRFPSPLGVAWEISGTVMLCAHISANVRLELSIALGTNFQLTQLNEAKLKLLADLNIVVNGYGAISMGLVTNDWQRTLEISGEVHLHVPLKVTITADLKDKNYKIEFPPVCKKTTLVTAKQNAHLVVRNSAEPKVEKRIPLLPDESEADLLDEHFQSVERDSREDNVAQKVASKKKLKKSTVIVEQSEKRVIYKPLPDVDLTLQVIRKARKIALLTETMKWITAEHEFIMEILPGSTCVEAQMVELEVLLGSKIPHKVIKLARREDSRVSEDDDAEAEESFGTLKGQSKTEKKVPSVNKQKLRATVFPTTASSSSSGSASSSSSSSSSASPSSSPSSSSSSSYKKKGRREESSRSSIKGPFPAEGQKQLF
ncbi:vitellogenin-2-like [Eublepharis macularius]|uniref:Vitellogenin-2-like n=1 Tax=Eublepharis macularius TaxID=481883 RepID=A0AA97KZ47_EUBMA|nr:vitellogenin-2-like [Eublepharis macularius]